MTDPSRDYDVAIIGGGSAGYAAARTSAGAGLRAVVIEGGEKVGGLCILSGCMPTKGLMYAAELVHHIRRAEAWGIRFGDPAIDFAQTMRHKNAIIDDFAAHRREELTKGGFDFIRGRARFLDPHRVEVENHGPVSAAHFIITTGSVIAPPPLPEFEEVGYITSDEALQLTKLPGSLIVIGGGAVGVEFAQGFSRFGVRVTLIQRSENILTGFDIDASVAMKKVLCDEGVEVFTCADLTEVRREGSRKIVSFRHEGEEVSVEADEIMVATGRRPNTGSLDTDKAGIHMDRDNIITDDRMQTSVPHIFAAGDCTGPHKLLHVAVNQGEIAAHNIAKPDAPHRFDDRLLLTVVFTDPPVASLGLTDKCVKRNCVPCLTATYPFADHGKAILMGATDGFVKLLADPESGEILGASCIGPSGGEIIHEIVVAMSKRMTVQELAGVPHYHPTLAEIWLNPAEELIKKMQSPGAPPGAPTSPSASE